MTKAADYTKLPQPQRAALRAEYVRDQGGNCHHCGASLNGPPTNAIASKQIDWRRFPPNFTRYPVHLHHSHDTGMTLGAVHALCNAVLWQYHGE